MKELVEYIAKSVVDNPDSVVVSEVNRGERTVVRLQVAPDDMGKVIGRQGRIAQAMRSLLKVAAVKEGARAMLEIE
ncbi:MAG: KH domain-containing protein [Chloroflexota bacterium]